MEKMEKRELAFRLRRQRMVYEDGLRRWESQEETVSVPAERTAVLVVDMWDRHWSTGATRRGAALAERINEAVSRARERGILIVHAPSSTMEFYAGAPARKRFLAAPPGPAPSGYGNFPVPDYPPPIDASDGGSDSDTIDRFSPNTQVWTRETPAIVIDQERDLVCGDEGDALRAHLVTRGIDFLLYMGVHTNMCVLHRSFGIRQMLSRGFKPCLVRDLTDAMYNPAKPPYVSHEEGTGLVVSFIEKFYCPTIEAAQI